MKRISPATVTFGVMAIVLGLVAAFVVRQSLRKPPVLPVAQPLPQPPSMVEIVIAGYNIPANSQLTANDLVMISVPVEHPAVKTSIKHAANANGRIAKQNIHAGQVIREEFLLGIGEHLPDLAERIPAGHRAVTINVTGATTGGQRVTEGDFVDIALTVEGAHPDLGEIQTRTLMKSVMVVDASAGYPQRTSASRNAQIAQQQMGNSLTVAVSEADANRLIVAERTGTLSVTLCSAQDQENLANSTMMTKAQLLGLRNIPPPPLPEPPPVIEPPAPPKVYRIEKYVGGSLQVIEMSEERINEAMESSKYVRPNVITEPASTEVRSEREREAVQKLSPFAQASLPN